MDEMAIKPESGNMQARKVEALLSENRLLRGTIAALKTRLLAEQNEGSAERGQLMLLREANQHLVLATFGAEDGKAAAETANRRQTVFLSMLAHELRNPIASITVANSVMKGFPDVPAKVEKMVGIVGRQVGHLQRLVDDLLDASRISTGKISLQTTLLALEDVIDSAMEASQVCIEQRGQNVLLALPPEPQLLVGDMVRLTQLFSNLLINASKFSPPSTTIFLTASVHDGFLAVAIKDQGKGIAPGLQSRVFDLFAQGPDELEHAYGGGLGIGLSLVMSIAQMHGGSVRVVSDGIDCGSEFIVLLPLPPTEPDARG